MHHVTAPQPLLDDFDAPRGCVVDWRGEGPDMRPMELPPGRYAIMAKGVVCNAATMRVTTSPDRVVRPNLRWRDYGRNTR